MIFMTSETHKQIVMVFVYKSFKTSNKLIKRAFATIGTESCGSVESQSRDFESIIFGFVGCPVPNGKTPTTIKSYLQLLVVQHFLPSFIINIRT